ncbi:MAG: hypothetical protein R2828_34700 [Saprospiraceae bacterium]
MKALSLFFFMALFFVACQNAASSDGDAAAEETAEAPAQKYSLTPFTPSASFADAAIESMTYKGGNFAFGIGGESYKLGVQTPDAESKMCANSGEGQHIHLIIDKEPYAAKYESSFAYDVPDGEHYLLAFLSRSYHESIKTPAAHVTKKITVANKGISAEANVEGPMLFYSRPKGSYVGKAATTKVMLDFYLENVALGADYKVKADINGEEHLIDNWQPYYIEGLPMGENTITLTLVNGAGETVEAPLNPVSRTFTLAADPAEAN